MTSPSLPVNRRHSLEEQAYLALRKALVQGVFPPGQKLSIRRIAAEMKTSPMPVRTALRRLATEQALEVLPSGTAIVPQMTRTAFRELSAIRASLEPLAVELAGANWNSAIHQKLTGILKLEQNARAAGDAEQFLNFDREFLFTIYEAARAPLLYGMIEATWLRRGPLFWDARWLLVSRAPGSARHADLLSALNDVDLARACSLLKAEIEGSTAFLLERMQFADDPPDQLRLAPIRTGSLNEPAAASRSRGRKKSDSSKAGRKPPVSRASGKLIQA
ncbi:MAG: GntR family transcriptional regulator [Lautropia sp.]